MAQADREAELARAARAKAKTAAAKDLREAGVQARPAGSRHPLLQEDGDEPPPAPVRAPGAFTRWATRKVRSC